MVVGVVVVVVVVVHVALWVVVVVVVVVGVPASPAVDLGAVQGWVSVTVGNVVVSLVVGVVRAEDVAAEVVQVVETEVVVMEAVVAVETGVDDVVVTVVVVVVLGVVLGGVWVTGGATGVFGEYLVTYSANSAPKVSETVRQTSPCSSSPRSLGSKSLSYEESAFSSFLRLLTDPSAASAPSCPCPTCPPPPTLGGSSVGVVGSGKGCGCSVTCSDMFCWVLTPLCPATTTTSTSFLVWQGVRGAVGEQ